MDIGHSLYLIGLILNTYFCSYFAVRYYCYFVWNFRGILICWQCCWNLYFLLQFFFFREISSEMHVLFFGFASFFCYFLFIYS